MLNEAEEMMGRKDRNRNRNRNATQRQATAPVRVVECESTGQLKVPSSTHQATEKEHSRGVWSSGSVHQH